MKQRTQIDNPAHYNAKKEKEKAEAVFLPKGMSRDFKPKNRNNEY